MLDIASKFEGLRFIDMGGGFGIPYKSKMMRSRWNWNRSVSSLQKSFMIGLPVIIRYPIHVRTRALCCSRMRGSAPEQFMRKRKMAVYNI